MDADTYLLLKTVHVGCATLSIAGFVLRFALMLNGSPMLGTRVARVLPHVVDTVLLASAIAMAWQLGGVPAWLAAKIVALLVYIVLGAIAIRRGRHRGVRVLAGIAAIAVFAYIVSAAVAKSPLGFIGALAG